MTDFKDPPPFEDPINRCPKCRRSSMFTPFFREQDAMLPARITWAHECGYAVVTRTADDPSPGGA